MNPNDILVSRTDAELLAALVRRADHLPGTDEAVEALAASLETARVIDAARMPRQVVALGKRVDYVEVGDGRLRTVTLVHPIGADAGRGRISVLSPVGRALLGRRAGNVLEIALPSGDRRRIKVLRVQNEEGGGDD